MKISNKILLRMVIIETIIVILITFCKYRYDVEHGYMLLFYFMNLVYLQCCNFYIVSKSDKIIKRNYPELYQKYSSSNYTAYPSFVAVRLMFSKEKKDDCLTLICKVARNLIIYI